MFKFLSNAMLSVFVEKSARDKLNSRRKSGRATDPRADRQQQITALQEQSRHMMTPEREELIRQAMQVQQAKQQIMADLNDEDRARLYALAVKKLLHEDDKGGGG